MSNLDKMLEKALQKLESMTTQDFEGMCIKYGYTPERKMVSVNTKNVFHSQANLHNESSFFEDEHFKITFHFSIYEQSFHESLWVDVEEDAMEYISSNVLNGFEETQENVWVCESKHSCDDNMALAA